MIIINNNNNNNNILFNEYNSIISRVDNKQIDYKKPFKNVKTFK